MAAYSYIFTLEENVREGGFGQRLHALLQEMGIKYPHFYPFAIMDDFPPVGTRRELLVWAKLDAASVCDKILEIIDHGKTP